MSTYKCKSCQGVYVSPDVRTGEPYYHACPPLSESEALALDPDGKQGIKAGDERAQKRDENIKVVKGKGAGPKSDGSGIEPV